MGDCCAWPWPHFLLGLLVALLLSCGHAHQSSGLPIGRSNFSLPARDGQSSAGVLWAEFTNRNEQAKGKNGASKSGPQIEIEMKEKWRSLARRKATSGPEAEAELTSPKQISNDYERYLEEDESPPVELGQEAAAPKGRPEQEQDERPEQDGRQDQDQEQDQVESQNEEQDKGWRLPPALETSFGQRLGPAGELQEALEQQANGTDQANGMRPTGDHLFHSFLSHIDKQWKFAEVVLIIVVSTILNLVTIVGNIMVLISFKMDRS